MKELQYLNKYLKKYKGRLLLGLVITIVARLFALLVPKFIGDTIDVVNQYLNKSITTIEVVKSQLLTNILLIIGSTLLAAFFTFLMRQTFIVVSRNIEFDLKNEVYQQYQRLSLNFYKHNRTGDLMNRISEDVSKVRMYVGPALMYSVTTLTLFIVVVSYMFYKAPLLTLYAIAPLPVLSIAIYKLSAAIHKKSTAVQQFLSTLTTFAQESFSGVTVIKAYGIEPQIESEFKTLAETGKRKNLDLARVQALFFPIMVLLIGLSNILVLYIGGNQFISGKIQDMGTIVSFLIYVNMLTWPVAVVGWVTSMIQQAEASQKRINEFLKETPEIVNTVNTPTSIKGSIEFKDVTFTYPDTSITALKNVSFTIEQGKTTAIIGNTGSGKSTILELIGRLYDINKGTILINQTPVNKHNLHSLRDSLGYVPQDAFLFSDTIATNIKFGKPNATTQEIIDAAKKAAVHQNIIGFKKGYDTILGERGITLSGGQKQRISIARALIKKPALLLLDDSLSAVDTQTEETILKNLTSSQKNKTTIIVSHRISAIKNAHKIIVLEKGQIIQQGAHNELLKIDGYYKELYAKQLLEKEN